MDISYSDIGPQFDSNSIGSIEAIVRRGVENQAATPLPSETPGDVYVERDKIFSGLTNAQDTVKVIVTLAQPTGTVDWTQPASGDAVPRPGGRAGGSRSCPR